MNKELFGKIIASLAFVACAGVAQAAMITVGSTTVTNGDVFDVSIVGTDFADGTIGGGFSLSWDPSILTLQTGSLTFAGDQLFGQAGVVDNAAGTWTNADVTSFNGVAGPAFDIALITFVAVNVGVSPTDVTIGLFAGGSDRLWASDTLPSFDVMPTFIGGSVTVNPVPVPAAVWLFGSGILGLVGVARRRNVTQTA